MVPPPTARAASPARQCPLRPLPSTSAGRGGRPCRVLARLVCVRPSSAPRVRPRPSRCRAAVPGHPPTTSAAPRAQPRSPPAAAVRVPPPPSCAVSRIRVRGDDVSPPRGRRQASWCAGRPPPAAPLPTPSSSLPHVATSGSVRTLPRPQPAVVPPMPSPPCRHAEMHGPPPRRLNIPHGCYTHV